MKEPQILPVLKLSKDLCVLVEQFSLWFKPTLRLMLMFSLHISNWLLSFPAIMTKHDFFILL